MNTDPEKAGKEEYWALRELDITSMFERGPMTPCLGKGVIEDTTYLVNITDRILLALKFELTQKYSVGKSWHC